MVSVVLHCGEFFILRSAGHVRRGYNPAGKTLEIEELFVREVELFEHSISEPAGQEGLVYLWNFCPISCMSPNKGIVFFHEWIFLASVIVHDTNISVIPENPLKLLLRELMIEPVKRLSHGN